MRQNFIVVRARPRRVARLARAMARAGMPEHAIARCLRVQRRWLTGCLAGNDLFGADFLDRVRAETLALEGMSR